MVSKALCPKCSAVAVLELAQVVCGAPMLCAPCGKAWRDEQIRKDAAPLLENLSAQVRGRMRFRGLGPTELEATLKAVHPKLWEVARPKVEAFFSQFPRPVQGMGIVGGAGVGKSGLMAALALAYAEHAARRSVELNGVLIPSVLPWWVHWPTEVPELHRMQFRDSVGYWDRVDMMKEAPLLVLDDLGAEQAFEADSSFARSILLQVLEARWTAKRPVLWTSNLTSQELRVRYLESGLSRIQGCGPAFRVPDGLPDRRKGVRLIPPEENW